MPVSREENREDLDANQDIPCAECGSAMVHGEIPRRLKEINNMYSLQP